MHVHPVGGRGGFGVSAVNVEPDECVFTVDPDVLDVDPGDDLGHVPKTRDAGFGTCGPSDGRREGRRLGEKPGEGVGVSCLPYIEVGGGDIPCARRCLGPVVDVVFYAERAGQAPIVLGQTT